MDGLGIIADMAAALLIVRRHHRSSPPPGLEEVRGDLLAAVPQFVTVIARRREGDPMGLFHGASLGLCGQNLGPTNVIAFVV